MQRTIYTSTKEASLDDVLSRISVHASVEGLLLIGSEVTRPLSSVSDYDLVIVLNEMPSRLHVGLSEIDHRLTDLLFVGIDIVDRIIHQGDNLVHRNSWQGRVVSWLRQGTIRFDRVGRLGQAQEKVLKGQWLEPISANEVHSTWFGIYYNLKQTLRLLPSPDPVHQMTIDLRLLFSLYELWQGYFLVRSIPWRGDKDAIRYLETYDRGFLELFRSCLASDDRHRKVALYEQLVDRAMSPAGASWDREMTSLTFEATENVDATTLEQAFAFWNQIVEATP